MKFHLLAATALVLMTTSFAEAAFNADDIAAQFSIDGYTRIEIKVGQSVAKLEAFKGTTKVEITYDIATGNVIKRETVTIPPSTVITPGVEVRNGDDDGDDDSTGIDDGNDDGPDDNGHHTGEDDSGHHAGDDDNGGGGGSDDGGHHGDDDSSGSGGSDDSGHHGDDD